MSDSKCSPAQAISAVGYLRHSFGGWLIPDQEERAHLRMFLNFSPTEVQNAIDTLITTANSRPSPNDIAQVIKASRPKHSRSGPYLHETPVAELTLEEFGDRIAELRQRTKV